MLEQLVHTFLARAGHGLIGGDDNARDLRGIMQGLQRHDHLRSRAVRVRDDVLLRIAVDRFGVHFGHDQRNVRVHAIERAVVDDDAASRSRLGRVDLGRFGTGGKQRDVPSGEVEMLDILHLEHFARVAIFNRGAGRARGCQNRNLVRREFPLGKNVQHFAAHISGGSDDDDTITHHRLQYDCP